MLGQLRCGCTEQVSGRRKAGTWSSGWLWGWLCFSLRPIDLNTLPDWPCAPMQLWCMQVQMHLMVLKLRNVALVIPSAPQGNRRAEIIFASGQQMSVSDDW